MNQLFFLNEPLQMSYVGKEKHLLWGRQGGAFGPINSHLHGAYPALPGDPTSPSPMPACSSNLQVPSPSSWEGGEKFATGRKSL